MNDQCSTPLIIGHRGASTSAPENTLAAFRQALEFGADGFELDAKLSADGEVVVIHDQTVDRTTDGTGAVRKLTLAQIKELDAGSKFDQKFKGEKVPTLEEVFQVLGGKMLIDVELTNYASPSDALPEKVARLVRKYQLEESIIFTSFHAKTIRRIRKLLPEVPAGILAWSGALGLLQRSWVGRSWAPEMVVPFHTDVNGDFIRRQHQMNRKVIVWTINEPARAREMIGLGVDGIITDDVPVVVEARKKA